MLLSYKTLNVNLTLYISNDQWIQYLIALKLDQEMQQEKENYLKVLQALH